MQYRKVSTGPLIDGLRVVDSGLDADDVVVVNGLQRVRPGVEVNPQTRGDGLASCRKALVDASSPPARASRRGTPGAGSQRARTESA